MAQRNSFMQALGHSRAALVLMCLIACQPVRANVTVQVHGVGEKDALFTRITDNLPLHRGDRLSHATYDSLKGDLQRTAATYGYLDAKLTRNELVVDPQSHKASISLEMQTGARYRFG